MIELVVDQKECSEAFKRWAGILISSSIKKRYGWVIEGTGIVFTNVGNAAKDAIGLTVMLGEDLKFKSVVVMIVEPETSKRDKGRVTIVGRKENGGLVLLREGRLQKNNLSRLILTDFAELSRLEEVPLNVVGTRSQRHWYIVAELDGLPKTIVAQTAEFANACAQARSRAGGGVKRNEEGEQPTYGIDEKGRITTVTLPEREIEVEALQGYVYEALKKLVGNDLRKPSGNGYCVDGMIAPANLLIEIKTSISASRIYEAVGQLRLYPRLIGINPAPTVVLLVPDDPPLNPIMASALEAEKISIFTYEIGRTGKKPKIKFSNEFINRCKVRLH